MGFYVLSAQHVPTNFHNVSNNITHWMISSRFCGSDQSETYLFTRKRKDKIGKNSEQHEML